MTTSAQDSRMIAGDHADHDGHAHGALREGRPDRDADDDSRTTALAIARGGNIEEVEAEDPPDPKSIVIARLRSQGRVMVNALRLNRMTL